MKFQMRRKVLLCLWWYTFRYNRTYLQSMTLNQSSGIKDLWVLRFVTSTIHAFTVYLTNFLLKMNLYWWYFFLKNHFGKKTYNVILSRFPGSNSWSYCLNMYGEQITMNIYDAMRFVIKAKPAVLGKPEIGQLDHVTKSNVRGNRGA